ncbi:DUF3797 domain-containing protein [Clostridium tagluense]|uniref:DUF3797 domain-containing protein n=1 Tax=Clostridium tagluense TaxID=360422 RepID=UPI001CF4A5F5|nr:DUF3797 domain-containing protein [Clostridium tagluense]MCB2300376.1 DUF3797 domain-containing protein [Clostridium tagluense]
MNLIEVMPIMKKYEKCPKCGNTKIGKRQGSIRIEEDTFTRTCKCGFKIIVDENGKEI